MEGPPGSAPGVGHVGPAPAGPNGRVPAGSAGRSVPPTDQGVSGRAPPNTHAATRSGFGIRGGQSGTGGSVSPERTDVDGCAGVQTQEETARGLTAGGAGSSQGPVAGNMSAAGAGAAAGVSKRQKKEAAEDKRNINPRWRF